MKKEEAEKKKAFHEKRVEYYSKKIEEAEEREKLPGFKPNFMK